MAASALEGKITDPAVYLKTGDCGNDGDGNENESQGQSICFWEKY